MAAVKVPQVVTGLNVFVDGFGHLGTAKTVKRPDIDTEKIEQLTGAGARDVDTFQLGKLEAEISFDEMSVVAYKQLGTDKDVIVKGAVRQGSEVLGVVETYRGVYSVTQGDLELKKTAEAKLKISASYYRLEVNGEELIEVDHDNNIFKLNGVDMLDKVNQLIM